MDFHGFKDMDLVEQVHILGLTNIHTFGSNIRQIRLVSLMLNYAKPRLLMIFHSWAIYSITEPSHNSIMVKPHQSKSESDFESEIVSNGFCTQFPATFGAAGKLEIL